MTCLRCGHCCIHYAVMIVSDPKKGLIEGNIEFHEGNGIPCKHLIGNCPGEYKCAIHDEEWYKETPCYQFDQIGSVNSVCRIGEYKMKEKKNEDSKL